MTSSYDDQDTYLPGSQPSDSPSATDAPRRTFPYPINTRYRCLEQIGHGSSGSVFKAHDNQLHRDVAIKFIHRSDLQERKRLLAEGRVLAQLDHPNICRVYEVAEEGDAVYLVMSLVKGQHLNHWREHFSISQRVELIAQVCDAIAEAHRKGIVHCDIKPGNIVLQEDSNPLTAVLVDFGIADSHHHSSASGVGTEHYMAPERFTEGARLTSSIDIYALGATLRMVLTGQHSDQGLETLPRDLQCIIRHCLQPDPTQRYANAALLAADLRAFLQSRPISLRRNPWYRGQRLWQRNRWLRGTVLVATIIGLLLILAAGFYQSHMRDRQLEQVRMHEQVTRLESQIDAIYRSPRHASRDELQQLRNAARQWVERAHDLPKWLSADHYASAGRLFVQLGNNTEAQSALTQAWQLGERSDSTAMALAIVHQRLYTVARSQAFNLPSASSREDALALAHSTHRLPALHYLDSVERSDLPADYLRAMRAYLNGDEVAADSILKNGEFPSWFYPRYELGLSLAIEALFNTLVRQVPGDTDALIESMQYYGDNLAAQTPSSIGSYIRLASAYLELVHYYPGPGGENLERWHQLAAQQLRYAREVDSEHPMYHHHQGSLLSRHTSQSTEEALTAIRQITRHYELALRYAKERGTESRITTAIHLSYLNQIRTQQTTLANLGRSIEPLLQRAQVIAERIPEAHRGPSFYLNLASQHRNMAELTSGERSEHYWQRNEDALQMAYSIAPNLPTVAANVGANLRHRASYLENQQARLRLQDAIEYLAQSHQAIPNHGVIAYNYAQTLAHMLYRLSEDDPAYTQWQQRTYQQIVEGRDTFPHIGFFSLLLIDLKLFAPPAELRQLPPLQQLERAQHVLDESPSKVAALNHARQLVIDYQRWRLTEDAADLRSLRETLEKTTSEHYNRAYLHASSAIVWAGEPLLSELRPELIEMVKNLPGTQIELAKNPANLILQEIVVSLNGDDVSPGLIAQCEANRAQDPSQRYMLEIWQRIERLALAVEELFDLPCRHTSRRDLIFL
ncbi:hypothetical protein CWE12_13200 [Aliidiomarina sedimenti]|uniref:Protein kinase domain-containing protein n=1 Tax=Aliidiomarina sedimenti TaxID=1933879 RepID=A0ABY0BUM7_9GAMM|nr:serine/threonine-protein kinase [Aliidiomarina sedimenti]RUO27887.1 hypothetical protein CWE12_13200 [Aliidiomarina sedimenti]